MTHTHPLPRPKVHAIVSNRWTTIQCPPETQILLKACFRFRRPGCEFSQLYRYGAWDGNVNLLQRGRVATGLFLAQRLEVEKKFKLTVLDQRQPPSFRTVEAAPGERPYQKLAVDAMIANSSTGGIVLVATGGGKTRLTAETFRRLVGSAVFVVDELSLLEQSRIEIESALGESVGVVGRSEFNPKRITVATIQTLAKHRDKPAFRQWFASLVIVILDEVHLAINKRNIDIINQIQPKAVFGLTATLQMDKPHIRMPVTALTGPVIFTYPLSQGVEEGFLSSGVVCCVKFLDPLRGISPGYWSVKMVKGEAVKHWIQAGSKDADYRYHISLNSARNRCIEEIAREGVNQGKHVVILVERRSHINAISKRLNDIYHRALSGQQISDFRLEAMQMMDAGKLPLIIASRIFSKGVDIKSVDLIIDGTALPGRNSAIQRYGRGARKTEGKTELWYINISDVGNRFEGSSQSRRLALAELGCPIITVPWTDAKQILMYCGEKKK